MARVLEPSTVILPFTADENWGTATRNGERLRRAMWIVACVVGIWLCLTGAYWTYIAAALGAGWWLILLSLGFVVGAGWLVKTLIQTIFGKKRTSREIPTDEEL